MTNLKIFFDVNITNKEKEFVVNFEGRWCYNSDSKKYVTKGQVLYILTESDASKFMPLPRVQKKFSFLSFNKFAMVTQTFYCYYKNF